jgi:hypothetical protein
MIGKRKNGLIKLQIIVNYEKTYRDLGFRFDGLLAQLVERTTLNR